MRQPSSILYIAVDSLIPPGGRSFPGLDQFTAALDHEGIPAVWLTTRSRLQFDEPRRKYGHSHPFIAEDGCAVYLPEGYFHLRPELAAAGSNKSGTIRLGRFTCIPIAKRLPAAAEALESLTEDLQTPIVNLHSLSPRELAQNSGLPRREAELARQRDFEELFFFAGASDKDIDRFLTEGRKRSLLFRQHDVLWSVAIGASVQSCIRELTKLYDRALRFHPRVVGIATPDLASEIFPACARTILLDNREAVGDSFNRTLSRPLHLQLDSQDMWKDILDALNVPR